MRIGRRCLLALAAGLICTLACAGEHESRGSVLVVGATGQTGKLIVPRLMEAGYAVTAFVRDATKGRKILGDEVAIATGDIKIPATIAPAMNGRDYVISAVGAGGASGSNRPEKVDFEGVRNLAVAAAEAGVQHFVLVSSMGVTDKDHMMNRMFGKVLIYKAQGEQALRDSGVPYTIVRPGGLINVPGGKRRIVAVQGDPPMDGAQIARADVAEVCVQALAEPAARNRTLEVFSEEGAPVSDWSAFFSALQPDAAPPSPPGAPAGLEAE